MPKLKPSPLEERRRITRGCIRKYMELHALNDEKMATKMRCTKRTFQNKMKRPETFTLEELWGINLDLEPLEKAEII